MRAWQAPGALSHGAQGCGKPIRILMPQQKMARSELASQKRMAPDAKSYVTIRTTCPLCDKPCVQAHAN